eukprot:m.1007224 g.1007224  ORF g.1007224 m.1007224 type:complete len:51 (-) comp24056_c1_seq39:3090-3242(-)
MSAAINVNPLDLMNIRAVLGVNVQRTTPKLKMNTSCDIWYSMLEISSGIQ